VTEELHKELIKVESKKGIELLCFVDEKSIERHLYMG
jgi:hypothetical protein